MARYSGTVKDQNGVPLPGALVLVQHTYDGSKPSLTDDNGYPLSNPLIADALGGFIFNTPDSVCDLSSFYGGKILRQDFGVIVGNIAIGLPPSPDNAGKYLAWDASGNPVSSTGTGADAGLRTDLAATTGAALVKLSTGQSVEHGVAWPVPTDAPDTGDVNFGSSLIYTSWNSGASHDVRYIGRKLTGTIAAGPAPEDRGYSGAILHVDARFDDADIGDDFVRIGMFRDVMTGAFKGGRIGVVGEINQQHIASSSNANRNYVGVQGNAISHTGDGGTDLAAGAKGAYFGYGATTYLYAGATNILTAAGGEFDTFVETGASVKFLIGVSSVGSNMVRGATVDAAYDIGGQYDAAHGTNHIGWNWGVVFTDHHGSDPTHSGSILIGYHWQGGGARPIQHGIDLSGFAISGAIIQGQKSVLTETELVLGADGSSNAAIIAGNGSTNASLILQAKGSGDLILKGGASGAVSFGTYTAGTIAQAGYITIKDQGGVTRRLLVG